MPALPAAIAFIAVSNWNTKPEKIGLPTGFFLLFSFRVYNAIALTTCGGVTTGGVPPPGGGVVVSTVTSKGAVVAKASPGADATIV